MSPPTSSASRSASRLSGARTWILATLVALTALAVRFGYWSEVRGTALDRWHEWTETDMATYLEQARRIADEDALAREPYHPYHGWQTLAPPEKWLEWYGPHAFHQAPAYSYVLAAVGPDDAEALGRVKVAQLVLGAGTALLVFLLAAHVGGLLAGVAAGAVAALYGPLLYLEPQLLREGPAICGLLAVLYATIRVVEAPDPGRRTIVAIAAIGAGCGLYATFHEMGTVLKLVVAISLAARYARSGWRPWISALGLFAAGYVIGFAPLLYRNVAVGAPPFAVSCRTAVNFAEANVVDAPRGGAIFAPPTKKAIAILDEAQGDFAKSALGVWRSYEGDYGKLVSNWWKRFREIWQKYETPDNTNYYFYRAVTSSLTRLPDFRLVFPPGLAAILLLLCAPLAAARSRRHRRTPDSERLESSASTPERNSAPPSEDDATPQRTGPQVAPWMATWRRSPRGHLVLLLYLAGIAGSLSLVHTVARFRMYLVPFFLIYAGVFLALAIHQLRARRPLPILALALLTFAGWWWTDTSTHLMNRPAPRPVDYQMAIQIALSTNDVPEANRYAESARTHDPRNPRHHERIANHLESTRRPTEAAHHYRQALSINPRIRSIQQGLQRVTQ